MFLTFAQVLERWLQQNRIQGFLLHMHEALQDHLKSVLDSILDRYAALALFGTAAATIILILHCADMHGLMLTS